MTDTSGPTREARNIADTIMPEVRSLPFKEEYKLRENLALAIDAHTQAIRAERDHANAASEAYSKEIKVLRDRLRLAVEARKAWYVCADTATDTDGYVALRDSAIDADEALRASGVEI